MNGKSDGLIPTVPILFVLLSIIVNRTGQNNPGSLKGRAAARPFLRVQHTGKAVERLTAERTRLTRFFLFLMADVRCAVVHIGGCQAMRRVQEVGRINMIART